MEYIEENSAHSTYMLSKNCTLVTQRTFPPKMSFKWSSRKIQPHQIVFCIILCRYKVIIISIQFIWRGHSLHFWKNQSWLTHLNSNTSKNLKRSSFPAREKMVGFKFSNGGRKCIRQILQTYQSGESNGYTVKSMEQDFAISSYPLEQTEFLYDSKQGIVDCNFSRR